ncbi:MAG: Ig-like domain-containing protein, partial [Gammaproteobacteria bacterium]
GLYHSHSLDCGAAVIGGTCTSSDYGDYFDTMGSSSYHFNAFQKERLGWLSYNASPPITTVLTDGVYWISPYQTDTDDPKALKILKSTDSITGKKTFYYLEVRRPIGFDAGLSGNSNIMNGVLVRSGSESSADSSYLLDMTPATASWSDPALTVGQTFSDADAGVSFTVLSVDGTGATVSVTFTPGGTATCVRANPNVTLTPSNQTVAIGGSANYTVTVTNADSSACTNSTFNLSSALPTGLSATFTASSLSLSPGASGSTSLQVASSASLSAGAYNFTVTATHGSAPSYAKSTSGTETLVGALAVTAATDKPSYSRNQSVLVTATVTSNGAPMANVNVNFTITKANGSVVGGSAITGANGTAVYKYRVKSRDPLGTYQAWAVGTMSAVSASATTSFSVQ